MTHTNAPAPGSAGRRMVLTIRFGLLLTLIAAAITALPSAASAKEIFDFFGGQGPLGGQFGGVSQFPDPPGGVAINDSGAGPANAGDVYVTDSVNNRVQRFGVDDKGTASAKDDTYFFISAWGADAASPSGGSDYEICTLAAECKAAVASGGNGTAAGNGGLRTPRGIAVDQDTGRVYVSDAGNNRVNVYEGDGAFVRSFGYDVVASGPGQVPAPNEKQALTIKATGGKFSLSFEGATTGARGMGNTTSGVKTITPAKTTSGAFEVGQAFSVTSAVSGEKTYFPSGTLITAIEGETLSLSQSATGDISSNLGDFFGDDLDFDSSPAEIEAELNALPTINGAGGSVTATGGPGDGTGSTPYVIEFGGSLAEDGVPQITTSSNGLTGSGTPSANVKTTAEGGAYEICVAADGDVCQAGSVGAGVGQVGATSPAFLFKAPAIAVSPPDGNPVSGTVFLADSGNRRVNSYGLDGSAPGGIGSATVFDGPNDPTSLAVDSRGILYIGAERTSDLDVERYDTESANGGGVGFLDPIPVGVDERQKIEISATAGTFELTFDGDTTGDLSFNATESQVQSALRALPSVGPTGIEVAGGPGNGSGSTYSISFINGLSAKDVPQIGVSNGSVPLSGGTGGSVVTVTQGQAGLATGSLQTQLALDPDTDGGGLDGDTLYVLRSNGSGVIQQFGPLNAPGLTIPPTLDDDRHSTLGITSFQEGIAIEPSSGRIFVASRGLAGPGVYLTGEAGPPPTGSLDSVDNVTASSATVHATINPNGPPDTSYHFEYSTDGTNWKSTPTVLLGRQEGPQAIAETIEPGLLGLDPNTFYHVRLVYQRLFAAAVTTPELTFATDPVGPLAETLGAPLRSTSVIQLNGRVEPRNSGTTFHFEYGTEGPCSANPCTAIPDRSAGSGDSYRLVAERLEGLEPGTTYHYRVVASNGVGAPVVGEDMAVTTLASEAPLSHGRFPGPPGSDRAWEMVSLADSGGNPATSQRFSADGNRALYGVGGGTPISEAGSPYSQYFAERTPIGWLSSVITPPRKQASGPEWFNARAASDLSQVVAYNSKTGDERESLWRFGRGISPAKLFEDQPPQQLNLNWFGASEDTSVVMALIQGGSIDPAYPAAAAKENLYEIASGGGPRLLSLLPGETVAPCGVEAAGLAFSGAVHSLSRDGRFAYFPSKGAGPCVSSTPIQLYARDLQAGETKLISGPSLSGPDCSAAFIKSTADAAFLWTQTRLVAEDSPPAGCSTSIDALDGDVYRYDTDDGGLKCLTCLAPGFDADISPGSNGLTSAAGQIGVAEDGSRLYFRSPHSLLPGAPRNGAYRLEVASGDLAYAGPVDGSLGQLTATPDGSVLLFASANASLDPLGTGTDNAGTSQVYRYDDADRSITCLSCPLSGAAPRAGIPSVSASTPALDASGDLIAFATPTPLLPPDQNTAGAGQEMEAGQDVYEWRDGRLLLLTDGLSDWPYGGAPTVGGVSPSGRDIFFNAWAQYTPDALDAYKRVYDARIGGGFEYPKPPPPCPLEVCQGTPKGAPEEQAPGTGTFVGPGNAANKPASCRKPKVRRRGRCVAKKPKASQHKRKSQAKHNGRASR